MATIISSGATHREARTVGGDTVYTAYPETKAQYVLVEGWNGIETSLADVLADLRCPVFDSGITVSGGATISGGLSVTGEETHSGPAAFQSGIEVSGGITLVTSGGSTGIPARAASNTSKFLRGDGAWADVSAVIPPATTTSLGGVIVGSGLGVTSTGKISVAGSYVTSSGASSIASELISSGGFATSAYVGSAVADKITSSQAVEAVSSGGYVTSTYVAGATVTSAGSATNAGNAAAAASCTGNAATATDASSLGGVAASTFVQKTSNIRCGSVKIFGAGTSITSGQTRSATITFSPAFDNVPTAVVVTTRGGSGSLAAQHSSYVYTKTASSCALRLKNTGGAGSATADCYVDWVAVCL